MPDALLSSSDSSSQVAPHPASHSLPQFRSPGIIRPFVLLAPSLSEQEVRYTLYDKLEQLSAVLWMVCDEESIFETHEIVLTACAHMAQDCVDLVTQLV